MIQPLGIHQVRRAFVKSARTFADHSAVYDAVSARLMTRLDLLAIKPACVVDLGSRNGYQLQHLQERYPDAAVLGLDPGVGDAAEGVVAKPLAQASLWQGLMRRWQANKPIQIAADPHRIPLPDASVDLVVSNLLLPWCHSPHAVFSEVSRIMKPGGAFLFSSAGPDTLKEYRAIWAQLDAHLHVFGLIDMHDLGDAMLQAGLAAPVLDRENLNVDYPSLAALQDELRAVGASNIAIGRRPGLMGRDVLPALAKRLDEARLPDERFSVTLELVQGHAWKDQLSNQRHNSGDEIRVPLEQVGWARKR